MMLTKTLLYVIVLCLSTAVASEVYYIIRPNRTDQYYNAEATGECLTFSQFINNSTNYLANDTTLIFLPGNHSFESDLTVENVHFFSMSVWPATSSKVVVNCDHNARFEFRNVSTVTVTGLEFVGCFNNSVASIGQFQLESLGFIGNGQPIVQSIVLIIDSCTANLDRITIAFIIHQRESENCTDTKSNADPMMIGMLLRQSVITIIQSRFEGNKIGLGGVIYDEAGSTITIINTTFINNSVSDSSDCNSSGSIMHANGHNTAIKIFNSRFVQNTGLLVFGDKSNMLITHTKFISNKYSGSLAMVYVTDTDLIINYSTFSKNKGLIMKAMQTNTSDSAASISQTVDTSLSIRNSKFVFNKGALVTSIGKIVGIDHSTVINNIGPWILDASDTLTASIAHNKFVNNTVTDSLAPPDAATIRESLVLPGTDITVSLNEFIANKAGGALVHAKYYTRARNVTNNVFTDNNAEYEIFIAPFCRAGLSLSLGSSRCIQCSENWRQDLIGIVVAAFIAGIALVIFMLTLNMTVAVGTLNGILFFAHIVEANTDTYFLPFTAPNFATVFISWLNLGLGFDVCFYETIPLAIAAQPYKALLELVFPAYVILLVIIVIVASEYSSKFAKIIGKGNPVAILATLILLSYARFLKVVITSFSMLYGQPAYGSRNVDITKVESIQTVVATSELQIFSYILPIIFIPFLLLCAIFTALVFSWQWLLQYQDKAIFRWVRYQKLHHFLEPYHAPYTAKYRYWTGLLLFVRLLLYIITVLNFSLNQRIYLLSVIFVVGGLILLKGVTAKRVYKNWPLDVMETAIYFNLVAFSALTWYNLDFGEDKAAIAYTSITVLFIFLLGITAFHILRYTRIYKCSFVERTFKWTSSKLIAKRLRQEAQSDDPQELDGYQLDRSVDGEQQLPTITRTVIGISND